MNNTENGINTKLNTFKSDLINMINNSDFPIGVSYYIVKDLLVDIEKTYKEALIQEQQSSLLLNELNKEQKEE